jgi:hypothetical protein
VYTDGACENNGRAGARAGIGVWFADSHPLWVIQDVILMQLTFLLIELFNWISFTCLYRTEFPELK